MSSRRRRTQHKKRKRMQRRPQRRGRRNGQWGRGFDIQKALNKTGIEFHPPGYQFMGPGTHLEKRLKRGDKGKNRLDRIAKQHDIDYTSARNLREKHQADRKMIKRIEQLPGNKSLTEHVIKKVMQAKVGLKI